MFELKLLTDDEILINSGYEEDTVKGWWKCPDGYTRSTAKIKPNPIVIPLIEAQAKLTIQQVHSWLHGKCEHYPDYNLQRRDCADCWEQLRRAANGS